MIYEYTILLSSDNCAVIFVSSSPLLVSPVFHFLMLHRTLRRFLFYFSVKISVDNNLQWQGERQLKLGVLTVYL